MDYFIWTPELSIGIPEIDNEHMKWISYINALHAGIEDGREQEALVKLLDDVIRFSSEHFAHEEALFFSTDYPNANFHKELHAEYVAELQALRERIFTEEAEVLSLEFLASLKKWLITHVQEVDRQYVSYVQAQRAKEGPSG